MGEFGTWFMTVTKLNPDGSIPLPSEALERLGLKPGDELWVEVHHNLVAMRPRPTSPSQAGIMDYFGAAKGVFPTPEAVDTFVRTERDRWR
jgi:bifunctional DNA-binding transcriptional regulator/antitoxin component of YhaV-PrlF toxin-antitoxin module